MVPATLLAAAWIGLGVIHQLSPLHTTFASLFLTALPAAGIWALTGRKPWSGALGLWGWSVLGLLFLPGFFPNDFAAGLGTGLATLATIAGPDAVKAAGRLEHYFVPLETGTASAPLAESLEEPCVVAPVLGEAIALPYEGQGHSLAIPVQFGEHELSMLFDTGASVTTLNTATLKKLGIRVPNDAPTIKLRTANGERTASLVQLSELWIGGMRVAPVTVGVCEECADDRVSGLLGLNVSGLFLVTIDTVRKEVVLQEREGKADRVVDISPWLDLEAVATIFPDGRVEVEVHGQNRSSRMIEQAEIGIHCGEDRFKGSIRDIQAGEQVSTRVRLPRTVNCQGYSVRIEHAWWAD
jgi:clan AA aspartic protease (TIGR02281 family)